MRPRKESDPKPRTRGRVYHGAEPRATDVAAVALAKNLNRLMLARGWRQRDVTLEAQKHMPEGQEFGRRLISSWSRGKHMPSPIFLNAVAKAFGVPITELIPDTDTSRNVGQMEPANFSLAANGGATARGKIDKDLPLDMALRIATMIRSLEAA